MGNPTKQHYYLCLQLLEARRSVLATAEEMDLWMGITIDVMSDEDGRRGPWGDCEAHVFLDSEALQPLFKTSGETGREPKVSSNPSQNAPY